MEVDGTYNACNEGTAANVQQWSMEFWALVIQEEAWRGICTIESSNGHKSDLTNDSNLLPECVSA